MKEIENEIINPALMLAISRMKENYNPDTQSKMVEEAMNARFLVPCMMQFKPGTEEEQRRGPENTMVNFRMIKDPDGRLFFMVFTDMDELQKWEDNAKQNVMILGFDNLAAMVANEKSNTHGFVINPSSSNVVFRKEAIRNIIASREKAIAEGKVIKVTKEELDALRSERERKEGIDGVLG